MKLIQSGLSIGFCYTIMRIGNKKKTTIKTHILCEKPLQNRERNPLYQKIDTRGERCERL